MDKDNEIEQKLICPNCGEEIKDWQIRCRNCGEVLDKDAGSYVPEPGVSKGRIGCFIAGLIPLALGLGIYWIFGMVARGVYTSLTVGEHLIFIIPSILYVILLWLFVKHMKD